MGAPLGCTWRAFLNCVLMNWTWQDCAEEAHSRSRCSNYARRQLAPLYLRISHLEKSAQPLSLSPLLFFSLSLSLSSARARALSLSLFFLLSLSLFRTLSDISNPQANAGVWVPGGLHASRYKLRVAVWGWLRPALTAPLKHKSPRGAGAYNALTELPAQKPARVGASTRSLSGSWASSSLSPHQFSH